MGKLQLELHPPRYIGDTAHGKQDHAYQMMQEGFGFKLISQKVRKPLSTIQLWYKLWFEPYKSSRVETWESLLRDNA